MSEKLNGADYRSYILAVDSLLAGYGGAIVEIFSSNSVQEQFDSFISNIQAVPNLLALREYYVERLEKP